MRLFLSFIKFLQILVSYYNMNRPKTKKPAKLVFSHMLSDENMMILAKIQKYFNVIDYRYISDMV